MRDLNEKHVYDLSELTNGELISVWNYLMEKDEDWIDCPFEEMIKCQNTDRLCFNKYNWQWCNISNPTANAKELFYTLENIQVDCRYLTNDQIDEIADVFKKAGYRIGSLFLMDEYCFIRENKGKYCLVTTKDKNKTKITYEKFMELFGYKEKSEEFKNLVEVLNEEKYITDLTLEQQLQKAEAEVKRLKEAIEDSKIKNGDWCTFWNHDRNRFVISKFQGKKNKFVRISTGDYLLNCEKITDPDLLESLNKLF